MPALAIPTDQIVITASRAPERESQTPASVTIVDKKRIARLGEASVSNLLRLTPSVSISTSGPAGSLTEVRIRGAEANHTLLFIDGIKINDPAGDDSARFELLNADLASRIEIVRGPQSALWGSDAIGGVIAVNGTDDLPTNSVSAEGGSFGFARADAAGGFVAGRSSVAAAVGWQRATGVDSFGGGGDKDGYRNLSVRLRGGWSPSPQLQLGIAAFALTGRSDFDGFDPITFAHEDTRDNSRNRLAAGRAWGRLGGSGTPWSIEIAGSLLASSNRNYLAADPINRTSGSRRTLSAQVERRFATGGISHTVIAAGELERETFHARDIIYGGFSDQDRTRNHQALTFEWRGETKAFTGDLALRKDMFNRFKDAVTLRASGLARLGRGFSIAGSYGEGIAQPTFFDLYGFFPGNFLGNPSIKPESSRGFEASLRYDRGAVAASLTGYRQRLHDEIVDVFDPATFLFTTANRGQTSRRSGIEASFGWQLGDSLRLSVNYAFLHATQPDDASLQQVRELRRPRHSGSIAIDGSARKITYGGSLAFVGRHLDQRDNFPFDRVALRGYWLTGARLGYAIRPGIELFTRISNALGQHYQDVFGYRTEPRGIFAGIRLASGS